LLVEWISMDLGFGFGGRGDCDLGGW
jgi:hypothetical protein